MAGSSPALFHVAFTLDFDGVPIRIHEAPVLAGHLGLLLGVDVLRAGRSSLNFDKDKPFKGIDGSELPCDGSMSLRDSSEQVVATLPLVHHRTTLDGISERAPMAQASRYQKRGCNLMYHSENLAAPASRRLGRAGLEAPPLRGQKILSF